MIQCSSGRNKNPLALAMGSVNEGIDIKMMIQEMYWASEGYLWNLMRQEHLVLDKLEKDFKELIQFWKKTYGRSSHESN